MLCPNPFAPCSIPKLSTGYICLRLSPRITTHSPPLSVTVDLQTTRCKGGRGIVTLDKPQLTITGSCRFIDRYKLLYYMHRLSIKSIISTSETQGLGSVVCGGYQWLAGPQYLLSNIWFKHYTHQFVPLPQHTHTLSLSSKVP